MVFLFQEDVHLRISKLNLSEFYCVLSSKIVNIYIYIHICGLFMPQVLQSLSVLRNVFSQLNLMFKLNQWWVLYFAAAAILLFPHLTVWWMLLFSVKLHSLPANYSDLVVTGDVEGIFGVDAQFLYALKPLDREKQPSYSLQVSTLLLER